MRTRSVLLAVASAAVLTLAAATASGNKLSISSRGMRAVWESVEFTVNLAGEPLYIATCPVTLEGSFHSGTMIKVAHALAGYVTRAAVGACSGELFSARPLAETLPWHLTYEGFSGTLPAITGLTFNLVGAAWRTEVRGTSTCLFTTTLTNPATARLAVSAGVIGGLTWRNEAVIPRMETFECPYREPSLRLRGTSGAVTVPGSTTAIRLSLI